MKADGSSHMRAKNRGILKESLTRAWEHFTKLEVVLASIFVRKLREAGLKLTKSDARRIESAFKVMNDARSDTIKIPISDARFERFGISKSTVESLLRAAISDDEIDRYAERLKSSIPDTAVKVAKKVGDMHVAYLLREGPSILKEHRAVIASFEADLYRDWGRAFDLLEIMVDALRELGQDVDVQWRRQKRKSRTIKIALMHRLVARACRIGQEVVVLLRSGLASGAHARWRSLHEIAVVARLLAFDDGDLANRYVAHSAVTKYQAALVYNTHAATLGLRALSLGTVARLEAARDKAVNKYGKAFGAPYGWASAALGRVARKFDDLEKLAGLDAYRPYYKDASQAVHASTQGTLEAEGLPIGDDKLLAGPSNYGLAEPGQLTARSLVELSRALLYVQMSTEAAGYEGVMEKLGSECAKRFYESHKLVVQYVRQDKAEEAKRAAARLRRSIRRRTQSPART